MTIDTMHPALLPINTAIDATLLQLDAATQRVTHTTAHVYGIRWYQHATHHVLTYQRWRDVQQELSKLTYTCAGVDEGM